MGSVLDDFKCNQLIIIASLLKKDHLYTIFHLLHFRVFWHISLVSFAIAKKIEMLALQRLSFKCWVSFLESHSAIYFIEYGTNATILTKYKLSTLLSYPVVAFYDQRIYSTGVIFVCGQFMHFIVRCVHSGVSIRKRMYYFDFFYSLHKNCIIKKFRC